MIDSIVREDGTLFVDPNDLSLEDLKALKKATEKDQAIHKMTIDIKEAATTSDGISNMVEQLEIASRDAVAENEVQRARLERSKRAAKRDAAAEEVKNRRKTAALQASQKIAAAIAQSNKEMDKKARKSKYKDGDNYALDAQLLLQSIHSTVQDIEEGLAEDDLKLIQDMTRDSLNPNRKVDVTGNDRSTQNLSLIHI